MYFDECVYVLERMLQDNEVVYMFRTFNRDVYHGDYWKFSYANKSLDDYKVLDKLTNDENSINNNDRYRQVMNILTNCGIKLDDTYGPDQFICTHLTTDYIIFKRGMLEPSFLSKCSLITGEMYAEISEIMDYLRNKVGTACNNREIQLYSFDDESDDTATPDNFLNRHYNRNNQDNLNIRRIMRQRGIFCRGHINNVEESEIYNISNMFSELSEKEPYDGYGVFFMKIGDCEGSDKADIFINLVSPMTIKLRENKNV